ncbi:MAG: hypothetical protein ACUVV1_08405 [Fimbriimonadales bacterium]
MEMLNTEMLQMMRDPLGAPIHPTVVQVLLVATFVLHIFFVTLAVGASCFALWAFWRGNDWQRRLARVAARLAPNSVGLGVVTGIAPLLFVQTIYDPLWYAANTLTGFWSTLFIFVVMGGYSLAYLFYLKGSPQGRLLWASALSLVLLLLAGWIMHVLANTALYPEYWREWYAPGREPDTRGIIFHAYNLPRVAFLLFVSAVLSLGVTLMLFAWYFRQRDDADLEYLTQVGLLGKRLAMVAAPLLWVTGMAWAFTQGRQFGLHIVMALVFTLMALMIREGFRNLDALTGGVRALGIWMLSLLGIGTVREVIRATSVARFNYRVAEYPFVWDWASVLVFALTSVVGVAVIAYLVLVLYDSGKGEVRPWVEKLGKISIGMLGAWLAFFILLGLRLYL